MSASPPKADICIALAHLHCTSQCLLCAISGLMHRSKFAVIARTFIALSCLVAGQEFMQLSALMLAHRGDRDRAHHFWQLQ